VRRRTFLGSGIAAVTVAANPLRHLLAADGVPAISRTGKALLLPPGDITELRARLRGALLLASDAGYDEARRIWNGAFDRHPALIARCAGAADVMSAVEFGHSHDLLVSVRGGGHSLSGQSACEGGLMIDLADMHGVRIDPAARSARVGPGALLSQFDGEAQAFGLVTPAGTVSHTGVAGLTLGGGIGRLARKYGLACDNLLSADVVTADGRLVHASDTENADLMWALRGGGGNFGVVTSFEFRLHASPQVLLGGPIIYPLEQARDVLRAFADFSAGAPDEVYTDVMLAAPPGGPRMLIFDTCYAGRIADGEKALAPLRKFGTPARDLIAPMPYVAMQKTNDETFAPGRRYYLKSGFLGGIETAMTDAIVEHAAALPPSVAFAFADMGGATSRVAPTATAFWHRPARTSFLVATMWNDPADDERNIAAGRAAYRVSEPFLKGFYVNDVNLTDMTQQTIDANYGGNLERLMAVKTQYDPTNLFHLNANVRPKNA